MNTTTLNRAAASLVAVLAFGLAACGEDNEVGDQSLLEFDQQQAGALGATTTAPLVDTTAVPTDTVPSTVPQAQTTLPPETTLPAEQQVVTLEVVINDASPYFDPTLVQVLVGSRVRFVNNTTSARQVVSDGNFDSGEIPAGGVWIYDAATPGQFNYYDLGRPFAVGTIQVG